MSPTGTHKGKVRHCEPESASHARSGVVSSLRRGPCPRGGSTAEADSSNAANECDDDEATGKRSLFCALQKACIDVLGAYDHRRVALQEVRFAVEDATRGQDFEHRLRDFNNLPTTKLSDVKKVLHIAMDRVKSRLDKK